MGNVQLATHEHLRTKKDIPMKKITAALIALSISGCVSTNTVRLGNSSVHEKILYSAVAIYRTPEQVPGKYEEIALLNSTGDSAWSDEATMYKSMQRKAAGMGANGIILDSMSEPSAGAKVAAALLWGTGAARKGRAIAIYVFPTPAKK